MALFETPLGFADAGMGLKGVTRPNMKKQEVFACPGPDQEGVVFPLSTVLLFGEPEVISAVQLIWAQESWPNAEAKRQAEAESRESVADRWMNHMTSP